MLTALVLHTYTVYSQDSTHKELFRFNVSGAIYSQQLPLTQGEKATEIKVPLYLRQRRSQEPDLAATWELDKTLKATDNPMGHGASYFRFHSWCFLKDSIEIYGSAEINNAGFSWGPYNTYNIALIPRYHISYTKPFRIGNKPFSFFMKAGIFENFRLDEGVTFYNMDMQGVQAYLQYKKMKFTTSLIADMQFSTGLNIDGIRNQQLKFEKLKLSSNWNVDLELSHEKYLGPQQGTHAVNTALSVNNRSSRFYTQLAYRFNDTFSLQQNFAFLAGLENKFQSKRFTLLTKLEYRYYAIGFNNGFRKEWNTHYRRTDRPIGSNFTGDQVYLISFNERAFSQWAVFTEYNAKVWVNCVTATISGNLILHKNLSFIGNVDFNLINAEGEKPFLYPFFRTGFKFEPAKHTYLSLYVSNATLNLDKHYTTYYLLRYPTFQAVLKRDLNL